MYNTQFVKVLEEAKGRFASCPALGGLDGRCASRCVALGVQILPTVTVCNLTFLSKVTLLSNNLAMVKSWDFKALLRGRWWEHYWQGNSLFYECCWYKVDNFNEEGKSSRFK